MTAPTAYVEPVKVFQTMIREELDKGLAPLLDGLRQVRDLAQDTTIGHEERGRRLWSMYANGPVLELLPSEPVPA